MGDGIQSRGGINCIWQVKLRGNSKGSNHNSKQFVYIYKHAAICSSVMDYIESRDACRVMLCRIGNVNHQQVNSGVKMNN